MQRDTENKGFFIEVSRKPATFCVQRDVRGKTRRIKIGSYPTRTVEHGRPRREGRGL